MKIAGLAAGLAVLALLILSPRVRNHFWAEPLTHPAQGIDPAIVPPLVIGMNTGAPAYYGTEDAFADIVKSHGELGWEMEPRGPLTDQLQRDDGGHPINVPAGVKLSVHLHDGNAPIADGEYHCSVSPGWRVEPLIGTRVTQAGTSFTMTIRRPDLTASAVNLYAERNGVSLTTLSCQYPGLPKDTVFRPEYLDDMRPFRVIRFMDWMVTNNEPRQTWATRATPASMNQIDKGVALEYMVALCNKLRCDPWFTLPLDADPDYYRNFATYVRDHLDPGLKAYVELSNEVWNDSFQQGKDATARGRMLYPGVGDDKANDYYYADRVRDLMIIWADVYKGQEGRIVRVLASQMWPQRGDQRLGHRDTWKYVDALAIAPYWGSTPFDIQATGKERVEQTIAKTPAYIDGVFKDALDNKRLAAKYGLPLITYEGGPGFWGLDPQTEKDMREVSHDPRLYALYQSFLERWRKEIGGLLVLFEGTGGGLFAHKDYTGQPLSESVKMRAVVDYIRRLPPAPPPHPALKPAA